MSAGDTHNPLNTLLDSIKDTPENQESQESSSTPIPDTAPATPTSPYNEEENQAIAQHLSSKYKRAIEEEHSTDLVSQATEKVLRDNSVLAAQQIAYLAVHATSQSTRLRAATYVVDRVLGPIGKSQDIGDKFAELLINASTPTQAPAGSP